MNDKLTELRELMNEILSIFDNLDLRYLKTKIYTTWPFKGDNILIFLFLERKIIQILKIYLMIVYNLLMIGVKQDAMPTLLREIVALEKH